MFLFLFTNSTIINRIQSLKYFDHLFPLYHLRLAPRLELSTHTAGLWTNRNREVIDRTNYMSAPFMSPDQSVREP